MGVENPRAQKDKRGHREFAKRIHDTPLLFSSPIGRCRPTNSAARSPCLDFFAAWFMMQSSPGYPPPSGGNAMNTESIQIVDRGRGLQLSTSRVTVQDLVPYFQQGCSHEEIIRWMPTLTAEEIAVVERYYREH